MLWESACGGTQGQQSPGLLSTSWKPGKVGIILSKAAGLKSRGPGVFQEPGLWCQKQQELDAPSPEKRTPPSLDFLFNQVVKTLNVAYPHWGRRILPTQHLDLNSSPFQKHSTYSPSNKGLPAAWAPLNLALPTQ